MLITLSNVILLLGMKFRSLEVDNLSKTNLVQAQSTSRPDWSFGRVYETLTALNWYLSSPNHSLFINVSIRLIVYCSS